MTVYFTHEMLNGEHLFFIGKPEGLRHFLLVFKVKLIVFTAAHIVQPVADADKVILGLLKPGTFFPGKQSCLL